MFAALEVHCDSSSSTTYTQTLSQHDRHVRLIITGLDLPAKFGVDFSNGREDGIAVSRTGTSEGVMIPDAFLSTGKYVYAFVKIPVGDNGRVTVHTIVIPVLPKPVPVLMQVNEQPDTFDYDVDEDEENLIFIDDRNRPNGNALSP